MIRRFRVAAAFVLDLLADGASAALPRWMAAAFRLVPKRLLLPPGGALPKQFSSSEPVQLVLRESDIYETVLPIPGKWSIDPWTVSEMQLHRLSPVKPDLIAWDVSIGQGIGGTEARLSLVRRDILDHARQSARFVTSITADTPFAPQFLRLDKNRLRRRSLRILGLCLILWLSLPLPMILASWLIERQIEGIETDLSSLSADVQKTRKLRDRITFLGQDLDRTTALLDQPERHRILDELAMLLPDDSWIDDLSIQPDGIRLHGQSADATALLDRFRKDPLFPNAHFTGPILRSPNGNAESFTLALTLTGGAKP